MDIACKGVLGGDGVDRIPNPDKAANVDELDMVR